MTTFGEMGGYFLRADTNQGNMVYILDLATFTMRNEYIYALHFQVNCGN